MHFDLEEGNATTQPKDMRVKQAVRLIDLRLNDARLTVGQLAKTLGISSSRLRQLFARELGVSPKDYIRECRLTRAASLLVASRLSVKEAMATAGFNDASDFSKAFKARFGVAPSKWRDHPDSQSAAHLQAMREITKTLAI